MDKLTQYRHIIQKILNDYRDWAAGANQMGVQECVSFDTEHDPYIWLHVGGHGKQRNFGVTV